MSIEEFINQHKAPVMFLMPEAQDELVISVDDLREFVKGKVLMPIEPDITTEMKGEHLGKYSVCFPQECPECSAEESCNVCNNKGEYMRQINVPWVVRKEIYKAMYATAVKQALQPNTGAQADE